MYSRAGYPLAWASLQARIAAAYMGMHALAAALPPGELSMDRRPNATATAGAAAGPPAGAAGAEAAGASRAAGGDGAADRAAWVDSAVAHYASALQVFTLADFPVEFADTSAGLATALSERRAGAAEDGGEDVEAAIGHLRAALGVSIPVRSCKHACTCLVSPDC